MEADKASGITVENDNISVNDTAGASPSTNRKTYVKEGVFLVTVAGVSILGGFGMTIAMAKRKDPNMFTRGLFPTHELPDSGGSLALRALGWGTFYAVAGVGSLCFAVWKLLGVHDLTEFRYKMGHMLPKIPKKENPGRGDFKSIRDLFEYIIEEDNKKKSSKES